MIIYQLKKPFSIKIIYYQLLINYLYKIEIYTCMFYCFSKIYDELTNNRNFIR